MDVAGAADQDAAPINFQSVVQRRCKEGVKNCQEWSICQKFRRLRKLLFHQVSNKARKSLTALLLFKGMERS